MFESFGLSYSRFICCSTCFAYSATKLYFKAMDIRLSKSRSMEGRLRIRLKLPGSQWTFRASQASLRSCSFNCAFIKSPIVYSPDFILLPSVLVLRSNGLLLSSCSCLVFTPFYSNSLFHPDRCYDNH